MDPLSNVLNLTPEHINLAHSFYSSIVIIIMTGVYHLQCSNFRPVEGPFLNTFDAVVGKQARGQFQELFSYKTVRCNFP